jgi:low affinity Fe/Cu permease
MNKKFAQNPNPGNGKPGIQHWFHKFACAISDVMGSPWAFLLAVTIIVVWGLLGPIFHYSDSWQLIINTGTTIITFLMVFLIQNTQNRDAKAFHLKLNELIHAIRGARNKMIDLDNMTDEELKELKQEFEKISGQREAPVKVPKQPG